MSEFTQVEVGLMKAKQRIATLEARVKELNSNWSAARKQVIDDQRRIGELEGELAEAIKRNDDLAATNRRLGNRLIEKHKN